MIKSICVYCGSQKGNNPDYEKAAQNFGREIATLGWRLVYGAGNIGLMGEIANAAQFAGGETLGVIPRHLANREVVKTDLKQIIFTETMHERKKVMFMNADIFALLPGGIGSLDEFFEVLTWTQLGLHTKPILLLNIANYWNPLIELMHQLTSHHFTEQSLMESITICANVSEAVHSLSNYQKSFL